MRKAILHTISALFLVLRISAQSLSEGNEFLYYERYESAKSTFQQLIQLNQNDVKAWLGLVTADLSQEEGRQARLAIDCIPSNVHSDPYYDIALGAVLLAEDSAQIAAIHFRKALQAHKNNVSILTAIARANIENKNGDHRFAVKLLRRAIRKHKHNAELLVLLGDAYRNLLNGLQTYKSYQKAIREDPHYAAAYHRIGEIFLAQNKPGFYLQYFTKAVAADPRYSPSLYQLYYYEFNRHPAKALDYYKRYLKNSDSSIRNAYELADLFYINNMLDDAIETSRRIIEEQGEEVIPVLYKLISYSYAEKKDTTQALFYIEMYFKKEEDDKLTSKDFFLMGAFLASTYYDDSLAISYIEKAIALESNSSSLYAYYKKLADLATAKDNLDQAIIYIDKMLEIDPNNDDAKEYKSTVEYSLNQEQ